MIRALLGILVIGLGVGGGFLAGRYGACVLRPVAVVGSVLATGLRPREGIWQLRASRGLCTNCGYDLRATIIRCPECGHSMQD